MSKTGKALLGSFLVASIWCVALPEIRAEELPAEIHTVLPPDAIQAILQPEFVAAQDATVTDAAAMIGVVLNGDAHAYSAVLLNTHEIVNDVIGGVKVATTW